MDDQERDALETGLLEDNSRDIKKDVWTTQDDVEIPIKDLKHSHLISIMKMLKKGGYISPETLKVYMSDPGLNGDRAQMAFEEEQSRAFAAPVCVQLEALKEEVKKRGLKIDENEIEKVKVRLIENGMSPEEVKERSAEMEEEGAKKTYHHNHTDMEPCGPACDGDPNTPTESIIEEPAKLGIKEISEYREVRRQIAEYNEALTELNKLRNDFETGIFSEIKIGTHKDVEEFRFEAKTGKRGLSPKAGFQLEWKNFLKGCEGEARRKLGGLVTEKVTFKGPTLAQLEKALTNTDYLRDHYDEAKVVFGYNPGSRKEIVTVLDKVEEQDIPDVYCHSKVAGTTHRKDLPWESFKAGDALDMIREPDNPHDRHAIRLMWYSVHLGYIKSDLAQTLAPMMDNGTEFVGRISAITGGGSQNHGCNIDIIYK